MELPHPALVNDVDPTTPMCMPGPPNTMSSTSSRIRSTGHNPASPEFGAETLAPAPGADGPFGYSIAAHSQYWDSHSKSLKTMARIARGEAPT